MNKPEKPCPKCGTQLSPGGGHGRKLYFAYRYCDRCDEFISWESTPMSDKEKEQLQNFIRSRVRKEVEGESSNLRPGKH